LQRNRRIRTLGTLRNNQSRLTEAGRPIVSRLMMSPRGGRTFARISASATLTMTIVVGVELTYGTPADSFCNIAFTGRMP